jgi:transcription elongation factor Elf1
MISATKAHEYQQKINQENTLGLNNCDNIMGNNPFLINRMKVSNEIRRSHNPLDLVQNIRGYDAQGNKILINHEAIQSGYMSDQGSNFEMVGSQKKSVNRMFERQFENQATFLNQSYNPHINQIRPDEPRLQNICEKEESKLQPRNNDMGNRNFTQPPNSGQGNGPQSCPQCHSTKNLPFTNDGGSVLICQNCGKTFDNVLFDPANPLTPKNGSPWFSDKYKSMEHQQQQQQQQQTQQKEQQQIQQTREKQGQGDYYGWTPIRQPIFEAKQRGRQNASPPNTEQSALADAPVFNLPKAVGMRGEGNYKAQEPVLQLGSNNHFANYANNQLDSYRSKFALDHSKH